jgi:hypothetical protein
MSGSAFPSKVTQVDLGTDASPARFPLGYEVTLPATKGGAGGVTNNAGSQTWVYVFNDSGTWAEGHVITMDISESSGGHGRYHGALAPAMEEGTPAFAVLGVAQHAIAAGSYGFILTKGVGEVLAGVGTIPTASVTGAGTICVDDAADALGEAMGSAGLVNGDIKYNCDIGFSLETGAIADGSKATCYIDVS